VQVPRDKPNDRSVAEQIEAAIEATRAKRGIA